MMLNWAPDALFTYFLPQQELVFKQRNGAKVTKRQDNAMSPHQRAVVHTDVRKRRSSPWTPRSNGSNQQPCCGRFWP